MRRSSERLLEHVAVESAGSVVAVAFEAKVAVPEPQPAVSLVLERTDHLRVVQRLVVEQRTDQGLLEQGLAGKQKSRVSPQQLAQIL